ncbi:type ISP restriction/modification enzyme [Novosphingobium sp.]|uniref:DEAD/DEAH box helicase n=1 Tax=Novosphingobium sp. TaxID=1874826 RepID=UPI002602A4D6|nr:type ISP restriction/modification enzyme [Novosphingobium sp.]
MSALDRLLASYRAAAVTEREKGTYFERLAVAYLRNDPVQAQEFSQVWAYADWAKEHGVDGRDTGIDLVAKLREEDGFAAIQCKFYSPQHAIQKKDIDSFLAASSKPPFQRRVFIDTTEVDWSGNAEDTIRDQHIPVIRIGLDALRESAIDWSLFEATAEIKLQPKKALLEHQTQALEAVEQGFAEHDRGKLLMACGTGKTYTALKIAEHYAGSGKRVLFVVPSLALIAQTVREWTKDTDTALRSFAVCSDAQVGKRRKDKDDVAEIEVHELEFPATTQPARLAQKAGSVDADRMTVVFSTYQSIPVLTAAHKHGLPPFDLIICDEAHRTTGATLDGEEASNFVKIHDDQYVQGRKRLYMTATPRIFGEGARTKAADASVALCDMDDESIYGPVFFARGFSWAVENGLLTDYKVIVLAMDETLVSRGVQSRLSDDNELQLDDATKIVGCYKALLKQGENEEFSVDAHPMRRAIAFCKDIRSSKLIAREFGAVVDEFNAAMDGDEQGHVSCSVEHVDGTFNAKTRGELLHWLGDDVDAGECRILSNARCLSEGVDVPSLDAIMFLHPRKSQIDVVQSVGRVMRRSPGKKLGYVILPVVIPAGVAPEKALDDNERYKVVWQILNALRAHDDRFDATINKLELTSDSSGKIEVIAVAENLPAPRSMAMDAGSGIGKGAAADWEYGQGDLTRPEDQLHFILDEFPAAIRAKIVQKCGTRTYWENWAKDIGDIAKAHIERIKAVLDTGPAEREVFDEFLAEIRDDLNGSVTEEEAIEMLAQHLVTKPVFDALFEGYDFAGHNPVSQAMQNVLAVLEPQNIQKEAAALESFYDSVARRAKGIDSAEGKQKIIVELYDKFFAGAFPKLQDKLGIVYTPVEVVDFIIHSVNDILQQEFGQTLGSKGVHILDPFTGTGTFITRLLQSGLIDASELEHKYRHEIHANEIVLLAYYIAAINIEAAYHSLSGNAYEPFEGICLTDTFKMYESEDMVAALMQDNSARRNRQKSLDIRVIIGNPPYNVSSTGAVYTHLNKRIADTYAKQTSATNKNALYDSYVQAMRWASDKVGDSGVIGFVTNGGWLDGNAMNGLRKCLQDEFSNIYVFNLRGNQRTSGELSKREGGKIFGSGSRAPVAVSFLVKNPASDDHGKIYYHDIGDYLTREQKLARVSSFGSIAGLSAADAWIELTPDEHNDWIAQRDSSFSSYIEIGAGEKTLFALGTRGVESGRDAWVFNSSATRLKDNISRTIAHFNAQLDAYITSGSDNADKFTAESPDDISWTSSLKQRLARKLSVSYDALAIQPSMYRPFFKQYNYYNRDLIHRVGKFDAIFPRKIPKNVGICTSSGGVKIGFSVFLTAQLPSLHMAHIEGCQCFPLKLYEKAEASNNDLFSGGSNGDYVERDGITDYGLKLFQAAYPGASITKEDIFYYVYGLLHSADYRARFADNLSKQLPRIPCVKKAEDFWAFAEAGRKLGQLHVHYESVERYPVTYKEGSEQLWHVADPVSFYRVEQMKFGGKRPKQDKTTVCYNANITMTGIPLEAYEYVVNGKSALDWVMERQCVKVDKASGIVNDANDYANETMQNPAYPLHLFQRVITVSLETMKIVNRLPKLEID